MFRVKHLLALLCLVQGAYFIDTRSKSSENYGPYDIDVKYWEIIKGPKQKTIAAFNFTIVKRNGDFISYTNLTILEQGHIEEVKCTVYAIKDTRKSALWTYRIKDPCSHFLMAPIFEHYMHAEKCVIKKGVYLMDINYSELSRKFFGASFFYGDYIFKIYEFSKNANILGLIINQSFTKKKSAN